MPGICTYVPRKLGKRAYASNTRGLQGSGVEAGEAGTEWKVENGGYLGEDQENFPLTRMSDKGF